MSIFSPIVRNPLRIFFPAFKLCISGVIQSSHYWFSLSNNVLFIFFLSSSVYQYVILTIPQNTRAYWGNLSSTTNVSVGNSLFKNVRKREKTTIFNHCCFFGDLGHNTTLCNSPHLPILMQSELQNSFSNPHSTIGSISGREQDTIPLLQFLCLPNRPTTFARLWCQPTSSCRP